jgi:hypothetical protein
MFEHDELRSTRRHVSLETSIDGNYGRFVIPNYSSSPLSHEITLFGRDMPFQNRCRMFP